MRRGLGSTCEPGLGGPLHPTLKAQTIHLPTCPTRPSILGFLLWGLLVSSSNRRAGPNSRGRKKTSPAASLSLFLLVYV